MLVKMLGVGVFPFSRSSFVCVEIPVQQISLHKGAAGWWVELEDSWDVDLGHNRFLLNVNMLSLRFKE